MAAKFFFVLCASALLVQSIAAYPTGCGCGISGANFAGAEIAAAEMAAAEMAFANNFGGMGYAGPAVYQSPAFAQGSIYQGPVSAPAITYQTSPFTSNNGGSFIVSMSSPMAPRGVTVLSENTLDGSLEVIGSLPVLATVALDGSLSSTGTAGTTYSCGSGNVGMSAESLAAFGLGSGNVASYGPGLASVGSYAGPGLSAAGLGAAIAGAELAGINAGLSGARVANPGFGCGRGNDVIYY